MKKGFIIIAALFLFSAIAVRAQQSPMFTQYMFNGVAINPAYAGSHDILSLIGLYRTQWVNVQGSPQTMTATLDAQLPNEKMGLALSISNDHIGVTNNFGLYGCYAYRLKLAKSILSLGVSMGINQVVSDFGSIATNAPGSTTVDPVFQNQARALSPNFGAGVYWYSTKYYAGFAIPQLASGNLFKAVDAATDIKNAKHFFITGGYLIDIARDVKLKPSVMVKVVKAARIEWDFNVMAWFMERLGVGVSYRTFDSLDALIEFQATRQLSIGYAHDFTLTTVRKAAAGTHEIMLRYDFNFDQSKIITPRYF